MSAGRIEQIGTPRDIYYRPANRAVAQFVGTINRLGGQWEGRAPTAAGANGANGAVGARGGQAEFFFRPEDGRLVAPEGAPLRGIVETVSFLGERTRVTVTGAAPDPLVIDVAGRSEWASGAQVGIEIAPEGLIALP
nr:TOBE domain-containing protein [Trinickia dinghuensis]